MRFAGKQWLIIGCSCLVAVWITARLFPRPELSYLGKPVSVWVREALDVPHWSDTTNARYGVSTKIQGLAVPNIVRELKTWRYPKAYFKLYQLQTHLPSKLQVLPEPKVPNGQIQAAGYTLCEMGEPARPGFAELARCLDESALKFAERQEVMWQLIQVGPVAADAVPHLRSLVKCADSILAVQAGLAIYNTEGSTNALASALRGHLARPDSFRSISRELWWFRADDRLQDALLPMICTLAGDQTRPVDERNCIVDYLRDVTSSNPLRRRTLDAFRAPADESSAGEARSDSLPGVGEAQTRHRKVEEGSR